MKETLESVISSCVNFVGVDLNTASVSLLRHVSGLNQLTARRIVDYRKAHGPFTNREQLMQVEAIGPATYTQSAGFLKILDGEHPLDRTWIHPESYPAAIKLLEKLEFSPDVVRDKVRLAELRARLAGANLAELAQELNVGEFTLRDIVEALERPERDPREDLPKPIFKKGVLKIEDLTAGMELKGTVLNVVDFGAFVDIGLKDSGLVHISQLANRYVKSPHDVVSVGDVVTVWVMGVDQERKRVSLTMVKPGTERQRAQGPGSRRGGGGDREGEGRGQGRRAGRARGRLARPARRSTAPPVGAPSVAVLAEAPARRPDRDRDRGAPPHSGGGPRSGPPRGRPPGSDSAARPWRGSLAANPRAARSIWPRRTRRSIPFRPQPAGSTGSRAGPATPRRPSRPAPPPPPLSKDALAGNVPLRTFGQLKQLWEARTEGPDEPAVKAMGPLEATALDQTPQPASQPPSEEKPVVPAATAEPRRRSSRMPLCHLKQRMGNGNFRLAESADPPAPHCPRARWVIDPDPGCAGIGMSLQRAARHGRRYLEPDRGADHLARERPEPGLQRSAGELWPTNCGGCLEYARSRRRSGELLRPSRERACSPAGSSPARALNSIFDQPVIAGQEILAHQNLHSAVFPRALKEKGEGRFLEPGDRGQPRVVISRKIARQHPDDQGRPKKVGDTLRIGTKPFEIIGLYETGSMILDVIIIMDIETARSVLNQPKDAVSCIYVEGDDPAGNNSAGGGDREGPSRLRCAKHERGTGQLQLSHGSG